jgi:hypothetical protein
MVIVTLQREFNKNMLLQILKLTESRFPAYTI